MGGPAMCRWNSRAAYPRWTSQRCAPCSVLILSARYRQITLEIGSPWSFGSITKDRRGNLNCLIYRHTIEVDINSSGSQRMSRITPAPSRLSSLRRFCIAAVSVLLLIVPSRAQDWIKTGTGLGMERIRLACPDFKASTQDAKNPDLLKVFNDTLWNDLDNA